MRLLVLLAIPMIGIGALAVQRIEQENAAADAAIELAEDAGMQRAVAAVYGPAQMEQIALRGLAAIDAVDVPREVVVDVAGVDFEAIYVANRIELDESLDALAAAAAGVDAEELVVRLDVVRAELDRQRVLSEGANAQLAAVRAVFSSLDQLLADAVVSTTGGRTATEGAPSIERSKLTALSQVHVSAGDRGKAMLNSLLGGDSATTLGIVAANARLDLALESFGALLDESELVRFEAMKAAIRTVPDDVLTADNAATAPADIEPSYVRNSAGAILDQFDFLNGLEEYSDGFHNDTVVALDQQAAEAEDAAWRTTLLVVAIALVSLVLLLMLSLSTLQPLRRLTRRAATISDGAFDVDPLPLSGPSDVRALTRTMNDMMVTLHRVDQEIADLAGGSTSEHRRELPGSIGVSLHQSFERLEATSNRLIASRQLAAAIVEQAADAIWTVDTDGIIASANDASVALFGIGAPDQIGQELSSLLPALDGEVAVETATGQSARLLVASSTIDSGDETLTAVIARDISERLRYEERLAYQAHHDALTGLPNRFALLETLGRREAGKPIAVLFVDLDGFKSVNDTQGHLAGDQLLIEVGKRLSAHVRPGDFVGRLGGDEFVIVMNNYRSEDDVVSFGNRIIREVERPLGDGDNVFVLSASVGVAAYSEGLEEAQLSPLDAIRCADNAVYEAKRRGRGRVEIFDARLQASIVHNAEVEFALRQAVRNNELELDLQPVFDINRNCFTAAEALVRWNRPGIGIVPPDDFVPIAERSSLIFEIGRWVLLTACETLRRWQDEDPTTTTKIAVNIAGSHLIDGNLLSDLDAALRTTGADPRLLEIELTETQLMDDVDRAREVLTSVRARGITVAIDDFGTGYSSMAYLRQLPIDTLKIDRSFVANMSDDNFDSTVIDALLTIGHALGLAIVAEGIEDADQLDYLASHGCDRAQGFHLARPMPVDEAAVILQGSTLMAGTAAAHR